MKIASVFCAMVLVSGLAAAQVPQIERDALIALYNATDGANWTNNTNWRNAGDTGFNAVGTECTWQGVTCDYDDVSWLDLSSNQLSGSIPPELGSFSSLWYLSLSYNQLSGSIPPELGNLSSLRVMELSSNQLSGSIPPELGDLLSLLYLVLNSNQLSGSIPPELGNLTGLHSPYTDIGYNALWTDDPTLQAFLDIRDPDWDETQTIAPTGVAAVATANLGGLVSWTPIIYTSDSGGYRVSYATTPGGPYTFFDITNNKTDSDLLVHGLSPDTTYYFIVESQTDPHDNNQNTVISEPSAEVMLLSQSAGIPVLGTVGVIVFISMLLLAGAWLLRE